MSVRTDAGFCRHFTGIQNKQCKLGIVYRELAGGENLGWATRIPCVKTNDKAVECASLSRYTDEEIKQQEVAAQEAIAKMLTDPENGRCPVCGEPAVKKQVGACVYGAPCGHRMYQGRA